MIQIIVFLLTCNLSLYSTPSDTTSVIDNIYNYNFLKASEQLSEMSETDPLINKTLNLEKNWWMAIAGGNRNQFDTFLNALNQFEQTEKSELTSIISSTYRMRYYSCMKRTYLIPFLFLKINNQIEKIDLTRLEDSGNDEFELFVLYKSFLTLIRNDFFAGQFLSDSVRDEVLVGDIENVIRNGSSLNRTIGRYFLMKYYLDVEKDKPRALGYLTELHKQYPQNTVFTQLLTN
jgi:hypothetical protein